MKKIWGMILEKLYEELKKRNLLRPEVWDEWLAQAIEDKLIKDGDDDGKNRTR